MGEIINIKRIGASISKHRNSQFPIVLCNPKERDETVLREAGYQQYALNLLLAEAVIAFPESDRAASVRETALSLIPRSAAVYLVDYEMLFDPRYGIDVLKFFIEISRRQRLAVKWCGRLAAQTLVYAEPSHPDYKQYRVADYDITCVSEGGKQSEVFRTHQL
jgi:hypothetical protein